MPTYKINNCPGAHCPGCGHASPLAWLIAAGIAAPVIIAVVAVVRMTSAALTAIAPAEPYIIGTGSAVMVGTFSAVVIMIRRDRARNLAWLREPAVLSAPARVRARASRPALPAAQRAGRALPAGSDRLRAPQVVPGQVLSRSPAVTVAARPRQR